MPVGENLKQSDGGNNTGYFWLWYPQIREILSKHKVFNDKNNNTVFIYSININFILFVYPNINILF